MQSSTLMCMIPLLRGTIAWAGRRRNEQCSSNLRGISSSLCTIAMTLTIASFPAVNKRFMCTWLTLFIRFPWVQCVYASFPLWYFFIFHRLFLIVMLSFRVEMVPRSYRQLCLMQHHNTQSSAAIGTGNDSRLHGSGFATAKNIAGSGFSYLLTLLPVTLYTGEAWLSGWGARACFLIIKTQLSEG